MDCKLPSLMVSRETVERNWDGGKVGKWEREIEEVSTRAIVDQEGRYLD